MNSGLQSAVYASVRKLYKERVEKKLFPYVATERDIKAEISQLVTDTLSEMVDDGVLQCHQNINGVRMFTPINVELITDNDI